MKLYKSFKYNTRSFRLRLPDFSLFEYAVGQPPKFNSYVSNDVIL